ncbi:MAG: DUF2867 domain-containing protein [Pseudomonas sp.]|uniref:DUF2867 domain-containing protein n=1 Tax=Pseudomonas sp. TaxID=306 RepID=UPI003397672D
MKTHVERCGVPPGALIQQQLAGARFVDCQRITLENAERTALRHFLLLMADTPRWIDTLMGVRNRLVQCVGLKNLGRMTRVDPARPDESYRPNDRVGIFTLIANAPDELLLADQDKHLDVYLSVNRLPLRADGTRDIVVSTVVRTHNLLGRLYMLPVGPFHRFIAPLMLANIARH